MRDTYRLLPLTIILLLSQLTACSETDSTDVGTSGVRAEIDVVAQGDGETTVTAKLNVGSGGLFSTDLELAGGDTLTATAFDLTQPLSKVSGLFTFFYRTTFSQDTDGSEFTVSLDRPNDTSAPDSSVILPAGFGLQMPVADPIQVVNVGEDLEITWQPSGLSATMDVDFETTCSADRRVVVVDEQGNDTIETSTVQVTNFTSATPTDTGSYTIDSMSIVPDLMANEVLQTENPCAVSIKVSRINTGRLDPNYGASGYIRAHQRRNVAVTLDIQSLAMP